MTPDTEGKRDEALAFLVNHDAGVLATVSEQSEPRARTIYYTCDDSFNVYFMTLASTRKTGDIAAKGRGAFVVSDEQMPRTLQIEGSITDLTETATNDPLLTDFVHRLMSHTKYGIPLEHLAASEIRFFKLVPTWVRWGDFTVKQDPKDVFTEIPTTTQ